MLEADSPGSFEADVAVTAQAPRGGKSRGSGPALAQQVGEIQPLPRWTRVEARAGDDPKRAAFLAGANLLALDQILRSGADVSSAGGRAADGSSAGKSGAERVFAGALRQRLALRAASACVAMLRLREGEGALRDVEHLAGCDAAPTPGGRLHRLWRLYATRAGQLNAPHDARFIRAAADCLEVPPHIDCEALAVLVRESLTTENPLNAAARVSGAALHILDDAPQIDAEIFVLWLADLVLAQRLRWEAPLPLLATTITHPSIRTATGRRPRPSDADWDLSVARAMARAAQEAYALAAELSRRSNILLSVAPKLRAKKAARVVDLLLADDCVSAPRAATSAGLSDRATRRLFDRLMALGAVRELSGRANFRLYGL